MKSIDVFIQGGEIAEILVGQAAPIHSIAELLANFEPSLGNPEELLVFVEDAHAPLGLETIVEELLPLCTDEDAILIPLKLHVTRCRHVEVSVRFNGEVAKRKFPPSATIGRVHHWAARRKFGLSPRDAAEHVLEIRGTQKRPDRDVHIGALTSGKACSVELDLVPRKRVEG
ncbi:hypothetical protein HAP41_0000013025 [Bradyrhizobium barranii subsp. apii]|uniref:Uncharacterized protein n=1 Tax=Bradyrhizobium barranii subsp. apii TaxID=2819348 RepID=A0A8T5VRH7_9BRAD|nr:hypothetical protein [Bradyrhizobium barranii]UPT89813.1 hypothetical protein HAP41_0000013025 [Bradyrhizobium barranii subsp. apii]